MTYVAVLKPRIYEGYPRLFRGDKNISTGPSSVKANLGSRIPPENTSAAIAGLSSGRPASVLVAPGGDLKALGTICLVHITWTRALDVGPPDGKDMGLPLPRNAPGGEVAASDPAH
jgi:hypothetical protein